MQYGYFDDEHREYVITRPDTPLPWINYLGSEDYFGIISNTAGGYSFYKDARLRRLTRYRYNNAPLDMGGRYIYLREDASDPGECHYWSPTWMPTRQALDSYECRHGMGYTTITSRLSDIGSTIRYFVPLGENLEIWELSLTNHRQKEAALSIFSAIEFCLWDAQDDAFNFQRNYSVGEVEPPSRRAGNIIIHKSEYRERRDHFAYFACSEKLAGFETDREKFLGPYRGWDAPLSVQKGQTVNSIAHGWQPIGVHHLKIHLKAKEQRKIIFLLGYQENPEDAKFDPPDSQNVDIHLLMPVVRRYLDPQAVEQAFLQLKDYWSEVLGKFKVKTPDLHTDRMVNIWNAYQVMTTFNMSRSASLFESGVGRGMGFRDSNQDLLGSLQFIPGRARQRILDLAATQLPSGGAYHQYQPLTKRGNNDVGTNFNDDPLWLVLSTTAYIKETADWGILDETVPYDNLPGSEQPLMEHLQRSLQYTLDRLGPHTLPLIGRADWNDCLNLNCFSDSPGQSFQTTTNKEGKVAESVFIAGMFVLAVREMIELTQQWLLQSGKKDDILRKNITKWGNAAAKMEAAIWEHAWDGEWFRRAYDNFGHVLGSSKNDEGQIFIEPQGMCIMAGLGLENGKAEKALDAVNRFLATPDGIMLHQPSFSKYYLHLGEISSYPPGYKENGSIFCHTNPWIMIAETRLGRGDRAFDYYSRINPSRREGVSDVHCCEPFVYAQMIAGKDAAIPGEAKNSWLTGTASWMYVAITQWILGIRPTYSGLMISPVVPKDWRGFTVERDFRGTRYLIQVERTGPGNEVALEVDGSPVQGNTIPLPASSVRKLSVTVKVF